MSARKLLLPLIVRVLLGILVPSCTLVSQLLPLEESPVKDAAQDADGQVWAILSRRSELVIWQKGRWNPAPMPDEVRELYPQFLGKAVDGGALCAWGSGDGSIQMLTRHRGLRSRVVSGFDPVSNAAQLFADARGNFWLTGEGKDIYRVSSAGEAAPGYSIATAQLHTYGRELQQYNPVCATSDGKGRVWIWSDTLAGGINLASLRGILIFDGEQFVHHPTLDGLPDKKFSVVEKLDDQHIWLAVEEDGLYQVDIQTLTAQRVPDPAPGAFCYVQKIFRVDGDWYVVAGEMWLPVADRGGHGLSGVLWRLRDGRWQKIINGIDKRVEYRRHLNRPWFRAEEGLWVGSFGSGPWFVPADGSNPMQLDWRLGVPLVDTQRLFRLNDRMVMAMDFEHGTLAANIEDLLIPPRVLPKVMTLKPYRPLVRDSKGGIWGVISTGSRSLSKWDGSKWLEHPLPAEFDPVPTAYLCTDSLTRIWLVPDYRRGRAAIYDPASNRWECFANYLMALQAQLGQAQGFQLGNEEPKAPFFSSDGRICFLDDWAKINYYDGRVWRKWGREQIKGDEGFVTNGPPFINRAGLLCVNIEGKTWEFSESEGWRATKYEHGIRDNPIGEPPAPVAPPPGCSISIPESLAYEAGIWCWLTWRGQLYKGFPGLCAPQFEASQYHPFIDRRRVLKVFADQHGNQFLQTALPNGVEEYVIFLARPPLPHTGLKFVKAGADSATVQFSSTPEAEAWFTWRLDGGPWSTPAKDSSLRLRWLPKGRHHLEATAVDRRLQVDPVPAVADFEVRIDPARQIASIIAALGSPDESRREAAVDALSQQPSLALPALRRARDTAGDRQRWWIDVAIQRIESSADRLRDSRISH